MYFGNTRQPKPLEEPRDSGCSSQWGALGPYQEHGGQQAVIRIRLGEYWAEELCPSIFRTFMFMLVIRDLHVQGIYKTFAETGGVRQNRAAGASFQRGQRSWAGGTRCSLTLETFYFTHEKPLPCDLEEVCKPNAPTPMSHHWRGLLAWNAVMLREHTLGTHSAGPTSSHHDKHSDFKLLNWKEQVIPALDTRSQSSNAFQSWTSCWELLRTPGKEIWWVHFLKKSDWSNSFNLNGEGNRQLPNGVFNYDSFSFPKKH